MSLERSERHFGLSAQDEFPERGMAPPCAVLYVPAQPPLFAMSKWASRAIGAALAIAAGVVAWILVSGQ